MACERRKGAAVKRELYKTELCRHYAVGKRCPYRSKCQFAHGSDEIVDIARHPKYKTEPCNSYHSKGFCTYGSRCHFVHDYTDYDHTRRCSLTRSRNDQIRTEAATGIEDEKTPSDGGETDQRKPNRRSDAAAAKEVPSRASSSSSSSADGGIEMFRGVSQELSHRYQGTRKIWRQKKQDSTKEDPQERSSEVQGQNADYMPNYLVQNSSEQSEEDFSVDGRWVEDDSDELTKNYSPIFSLFGVKESVGEKFESSSFYTNSFSHHFHFPGTRPNENPTTAPPGGDPTNFRTMSTYPNAQISSNEFYGESPDLFKLQTSHHHHHQQASPNVWGKLWTQRLHKQPENVAIDPNDSGDQNVKEDVWSSIRSVTADVFRRSSRSPSQSSSSVSNELVYDKRKINCEVLSSDLRRIFEDLSKEQMFTLQSSLLMDTLNQNLQQSTYG